MSEHKTTVELRDQYVAAWGDHFAEYHAEISAAYQEFDRTHNGVEFCRRRDVAETCFQATVGMLYRGFQDRTGESLL